MAKKCPPGKYYCFTDKKCKKIPYGYRIGARGYLARDTKDDDNETKKNGNGSSNGNGNGGNGSGNGNGGNGGDGGGNGGGGMGESIVYETSNPRIPRKKGQPAKSKKHSDLYTDEDPKGTIHGLGFKDVAKAKASVSKIRNSSRSHAHKIQAAVAMEQRAREMGKTSEAAVYRKYINAMKKKTKKMNESLTIQNWNIDDIKFTEIETIDIIKPKKLREAANPAQQAAIAIDMKKKGKKPKSMKEGMYNHSDVGLITNAVIELEDGLKTLKTITYDSVDQLMQGIAKRNDISPTLLHNQFKAKHFTIPDDWAIRYRMNKMKGIEEATMTPAQKRKDTMLKKKYDKSDMKKSMQKQYGKEEGKKVYFATIRKQAMKEERGRKDFKINPDLEAAVRKKQKEIQDKQVNLDDKKNKVTDSGEFQKNKPVDAATRKRMNAPENQFNSYELSSDDKYNVSEEGLRDWFGKSSGTTKSGRKVRGWVQVGGKYDGKPCARQPGQKSTPKCVSSAKRRSMSDKERDSAARRKRAADPNQPQKSGAAKPTNVSTDPKKKMKESFVNEAKDKKGKGSGTKDACYHKVKSRYSVWPSAYASGALVKCRKVGAANWGNKSKNEGFSPMQVAALEAAGMIEIKEGKKCWKGYKKAGTQKLFGKTYNRCVKAGDELNHDGEQLQEMNPSFDIKQTKTQKLQKMSQSDSPNEAAIAKKKLEQRQAKEPKLPKMESYAKVTEGVMTLMKKREEKKKSKPSVSTYVSKSKSDAGNKAAKIMRDKEQMKYVGFLPANEEATNESKTRLVKNGHTYKVILTWRGKTYMIQMFVPSVSRPTRQQVEKEVQKVYPDAKLMSFLPKDLEPGEPTVMVGEEKLNELSLDTLSQAAKVAMTKRDAARGTSEFVKRQKQTEKFTNAAVKKRRELDSTKDKLKKSFDKPDADRTPTMEEYISELSPKTLGSYIRGASFDLHRDSQSLGGAGNDTRLRKDLNTSISKRAKGIYRATNKLEKKAESGKPPEKPENKRNVMRGASPDSTQSFSQEEYVAEDDMKGMSVKSGHKRPTKSGAGMTQKGVEAYRRRNPGSKLKTAVTGKVKKGSKDAKRRKSYCARSAGQMKKFPKAAKDPNSRLRQARRRWKC